MAERSIGVLWAVAAAAILGVLVAAATSGSTPSTFLLVALVVVPVAIALILRAQRSRRGGRYRAPDQHYRREGRTRRAERAGGKSRLQRDRTHVSPGTDAEQLVPLGNEDWDELRAICGALDSRDLDWLRRNDFVTPWLDGRARRVLELEPLVAAAANRPFARDIRSALLFLSDAIGPFAAYYEDNTFPDPLLLGEEWRFFQQDDSSIVEERATGDDIWGGRAKELHRLAAPVADAYEGVVLVATKNPTTRRRVGVPV